MADLLRAGGEDDGAGVDWANIELKYAGYLQRERANASRLAEMESLRIPDELAGMRRYTRSPSRLWQKLHRARPATLGQAWG